MNKQKTTSNISATIVIVCILFLPFVGCGGSNLNGIDILKDDQISTNIKLFIIAAIICAGLIFALKENIHHVVFSIAGSASLLIAYLIAHSKNDSIELKMGAFFAIIGFGVIAITNYMAMSDENQIDKKPSLSDNNVDEIEKEPVIELTDEEFMKKYGITFHENKYVYESYKYDKLIDAINYAKQNEKRCIASYNLFLDK